MSHADKLREVIEEARLLIRDGEPELILNDLIALLADADHAEEWRAEFQSAGGGWFVTPDGRNTEWGSKEWAEDAAKNWRNDGFRVRLVCRRIFEPWEVTP